MCVCVCLQTDSPHPYLAVTEERPFLFPETDVLCLEHRCPDNKGSLKDHVFGLTFPSWDRPYLLFDKSWPGDAAPTYPEMHV